MSIGEAQEYYIQGLAQLDQMGGDDFDLIYSALHYAAEQPGGFVKPELSHRLMGLCQTIFQHEPSKFGWTLFGRAAAASIGFPAIYKLVRWADQDVADYSYGLPQLACYLAQAGHLDARRAAVLLTICEDHGWHEWQVGKGLHDILLAADPSSRSAIFSLVTGKLNQEHSSGGWEGLWEGLLGCVDAFEEINGGELRDHLQRKLKAARHRRDAVNSRNSSSGTDAAYSIQSGRKKKDELDGEGALKAIVAVCDPTSAASLDKAISDARGNDGLPFDNTKRLLDELRKVCPYQKRVKFLEAVCESAELQFDFALDLVFEYMKDWRESSVQVRNSAQGLITRLFAFKGSELFELRYSGISRQIYRLSDLCGDQKFVLQTVLETVVKERLELGGDEWLQLATSLSSRTDPQTALEVFEHLLSSSAAKVGDEIGEGVYNPAFGGKDHECDVVADIIWHLLGDSDAFIRWNAARSLKGILDVGLVEDIERLLDRFDTDENPSLVSEEHHFAFLNAQQWLLMGLARAALHNGEKLKPIRNRILELARRDDLHVINKLHLLRCLKHIDADKSLCPDLARLWDEVQSPKHGIVVRDGWPDNKDRQTNFGFEYDYERYKISNLARLFWISDNEASDYISDEITKRWPSANKISDFPGGIRYRGDERYEAYAEHIQRHAGLHAATTLVKSMPVARRSYDWDDLNPWQEFIEGEDVSFRDGTWLSDHKDQVPAQAREYLLGERKGNEEALLGQELLFRKIGFTESEEDHLLPLYGYWTTPDGVHVRITSAIVVERGAVKRCQAFAKIPDHDFWLPSFGSNGLVDRHAQKKSFDPLIWTPEKYPIGIDERDEWATKNAITRPKLGLAINKVLGLASDDGERNWRDASRNLALKSEVWGEWQPDADARGSRYQNEGAILWAERGWLDRTLKSSKRSLIFNLNFSKHSSSKSYEDSSGVRGVYVGLKRAEELPRFWFAKNASANIY